MTFLGCDLVGGELDFLKAKWLVAKLSGDKMTANIRQVSIYMFKLTGL